MSDQTDHTKLQDLLSGVLFSAIGLIGVIGARGWSLGSMGRIGAGSFPLAVSALLILFGVIIILRSLPGSLRGRRVHFATGRLLRPIWAIAVVTGSLLSFALIIEPLGLAFSSVACVGIAYFGGRRLIGRAGGLVEGAALTVGLSVFVVVVFAYAIGLPFSVWP